MEITPQSSSASMAVASYPFPLELPQDVVISVLAFSDPADILSMRKTCRANYKTTKLRAVWLTALDRICDRYGIFKPTYPQNSMTISDLEHASLSPHLFMNLFRKYGDITAPLAYQTRILHGRTRKPGSQTDRAQVSEIDIYSIFVVPGGRFLITSGGTADSKLCLWDLGYHANTRMKLQPIARLQQTTAGVPSHPDTIKGVAPSSDGRNLIIATQAPVSLGGQHKGIISVHRIDPCSADPTFQLEGQLELCNFNLTTDLPMTVDYVCLTHDYLFIYDAEPENGAWGYFVLWNWKSSAGIKWDVNFPDDLDTNSVYVSERLIIVCHSGKVLRWEVPPLQPIANNPSQVRQHTNSIPLVTHMPTDIEYLPHPEYPAKSLWGTSIWQRRGVSQSDEHLCLFVEALGICVYNIQRIAGTNGSLLPCGISSPDSRFGDSAISPLFNVDGHLVYCPVSHSQRFVAAAIPLFPPSTDNNTSSSHPAEQFQYMAISLTDVREDGMSDQELDSVGFCPMSGRFVYFWGSDSSELHVSDFLLPPD